MNQIQEKTDQWDLNGLRVFVQVARWSSFTRAAEVLRLTPSAVSKAMSRLEQHLGVQLLYRNTRSVSLTADGDAFLARCQNVLDEIENAAAQLLHTRTDPRGRLRLLCPVGFGRQVVVPSLLAFRNLYPDIQIDLELSDRRPDVMLEGLDAVLHVGGSFDEGLISHRLGRYRMVACAAPAYLAKCGVPMTPDDLDQHECLAYALPLLREYRDWVFEGKGKRHRKTVQGSININHAESLMEMAIGGAGIVLLSTFVTESAIRSGRLVPLLTDYESHGAEISIAYPANRQLSAKIKVFKTFMYEQLSRFSDLTPSPEPISI